MKKTLAGLTAASVLSVPFFIKGLENSRKKVESRELFENALEMAAGDDNFLSGKEKSDFLREMGVDSYIQEGDVLYFTPNAEEIEIKVNDKYRGRTLGYAKLKDVKNYLSEN